MNKLHIPPTDAPYIEALRQLIRTGVTAAPGLEESPLVDLPVVRGACPSDASPTRRAHAFIQILQRIIAERLAGHEAKTATILFGLSEYAGVAIQDRYRAVAKLYNPYWTWENYRKEPLTRHLLAVYLALKREPELVHSNSPEHSKRRTVLIVQNISREGPGLLRRILAETAIPYHLVDLSQGQSFPDPTEYGALVVLGGPDSANDTTPKMQDELERVGQALRANVPYLGICLGLQVAVKVAGGNVVPGVKEVGLHAPDGTPYSVSLTDLALTALGKKDPLFLGLRNDFRVFQLHGETVETTAGMQLLATGRHCRTQIIKINSNAYGIQSHFELTREMLQEWLQAEPDLTPLAEQAVLAEFDALEEVYTITGLSLLRNFLHIAKLI
jgi:GMP synthase (glutamine-hydrolysing)